MRKSNLDDIISKEIPNFRKSLLKTLKTHKYSFNDLSKNYKKICEKIYGKFSELIYDKTINYKVPNRNLLNRIGSIIKNYNESDESKENKITENEIYDIIKKISLYSYLKNSKEINIKEINKIIIPHLESKLIKNGINEKKRKSTIYKIYNSRKTENPIYEYKIITNYQIKSPSEFKRKYSKNEILEIEKARDKIKENSYLTNKEIKKTIKKEKKTKKKKFKKENNSKRRISIPKGAKTIKETIIEEEIKENLDFTNKEIEKILKEKPQNNDNNKRLNVNEYNIQINIKYGNLDYKA